MWSPSDYTTVVPEYADRAALFTNHNVTACQSTRGHQEQTENPWYMLYNRSSRCIVAKVLECDIVVSVFER